MKRAWAAVRLLLWLALFAVIVGIPGYFHLLSKYGTRPYGLNLPEFLAIIVAGSYLAILAIVLYWRLFLSHRRPRR